MNKCKISIFSCFLLATISFNVFAGAVFDDVKKRGFLRCGVSDGLPGFSIKGENGKWTGLDVDYCRALSAAVFGDDSKVEYVVTTTDTRLDDLNSGKIDVLSRNTTWTLGREADYKISFAGVMFYDGQGFMVKKDLGVYSSKHLNGASFCVESGTTSYNNLVDYYDSMGMKIKVVPFHEISELSKAFFSGQCDVYTSDSSTLASIRSAEAPNAYEYMILPDLISKEPLGPSVKNSDSKWFNIARWTLFALTTAEENNITSENVDKTMQTSNAPEVKRFLGVTPGMGKKLGLSDRWAYNIVKHVGNYSEIFERNVGVDSELKLPRGMNNLYTEGGIMYSPPVR